MKKKWRFKLLWLCLYSAVTIGNINFGHLGDLTKGSSFSFVEVNSCEMRSRKKCSTILFFNFDIDKEVIFIIFIKCPLRVQVEGARRRLFLILCILHIDDVNVENHCPLPRPAPASPPSTVLPDPSTRRNSDNQWWSRAEAVRGVQH